MGVRAAGQMPAKEKRIIEEGAPEIGVAGEKEKAINSFNICSFHQPGYCFRSYIISSFLLCRFPCFIFDWKLCSHY
jgi:hypothetical protein